MKPISIDITSNSLTIWDMDDANKIYAIGFFGKPLGIRKATPGIAINRPLSLSYFDAMYLIEKGVIQVKKDAVLSADTFMEYATGMYMEFREKYHVYREFRDLGYIVRPGLKFGTDFIIYLKGPGLDHSKWAVLVEKDDSELSTINIVRAGRLAHSVKKTLLIATKTVDKHKFFSFSRFKL